MRGIHRSPVNSLHKGQWRGALIFYLRLNNDWANNREVGFLRCSRAEYDVTIMYHTRSLTNHIYYTQFDIICLISCLIRVASSFQVKKHIYVYIYIYVPFMPPVLKQDDTLNMLIQPELVEVCYRIATAYAMNIMTITRWLKIAILIEN